MGAYPFYTEGATVVTSAGRLPMVRSVVLDPSRSSMRHPPPCVSFRSPRVRGQARYASDGQLTGGERWGRSPDYGRQVLSSTITVSGLLFATARSILPSLFTSAAATSCCQASSFPWRRSTTWVAFSDATN